MDDEITEAPATEPDPAPEPAPGPDDASRPPDQVNATSDDTAEIPVSDAPPKRVRRKQPWPIRLTHWLNIPIIVIMAGSGLQILSAYPYMGPQGAQWGWYPLQGFTPPHWLKVGGWLAGGRHWHFAVAWLLVVNASIYLAYFFGSGEWRRRLFIPWHDLQSAILTWAYYVRIVKNPPEVALYNGLQKLAYTGALLFGLLMVLSGLAIYKPVQLHWLTLLFGGYDGARLVHFGGLLLLAGFVAIHLVLVALHPRDLLAMITGGSRG